ncbi:hypothetical protein [Kitasatospora sp. NBC_00458]|uniref:hypothetical protein n=1 Tax=Kitasatospora sp. NBC_00458 TaxID=2903568 RepID=UPI002E18048E
MTGNGGAVDADAARGTTDGTAGGPARKTVGDGANADVIGGAGGEAPGNPPQGAGGGAAGGARAAGGSPATGEDRGGHDAAGQSAPIADAGADTDADTGTGTGTGSDDATVADAVPPGPPPAGRPGPDRLRWILGRIALVAVALGLFSLTWLAVSRTVPHIGYSAGSSGVRGMYAIDRCPAEPSADQRAELPPGGCDGTFLPAGGEPTYRYALNEETTYDHGVIPVRCGGGECHETGFRATVWWLALLVAGLAALPAGGYLIVCAVSDPLADRLYAPAGATVGTMLGLALLLAMLTGRGSA